MQPLVILRILGLLMLLSSSTLLPPIVTGLIYDDGAVLPFVEAFVLTLIAGFALYLPVRNHRSELRLRDGFLVVVLFWTVLGVAGGLPIYLTGVYDISVTDSVFESISGITTTGATVIVGIDSLPHSLLLYRQELQWLGGMGIIVLAVAVLPMLGVGGMQLFRAETPGPVKDTKLTPRITETAKALWYIYLGLTVACFGTAARICSASSGFTSARADGANVPHSERTTTNNDNSWRFMKPAPCSKPRKKGTDGPMSTRLARTPFR